MKTDLLQPSSFNLHPFFERFDQFADAPDAVAKMRELTLLLALDGKIGDTDAATWERVQLGDLGEWGSGGTPLSTESRYYVGNIPWLIIGDLNDGVVTSSMKTITEEGLASSSARMLPKNVLLIAMYGSIGKLGITGIECATNQAIAFCKPDPERADLRYLFHAFMGLRPKFLSRGQGLAQKNISQRILRAWEIGLPPLAEQKRIVAKVDELMALCDRLEAQQQERETRHAALARASLARFALNPQPSTLNFLFHPSYAIPPAALRKSILTLAVQGKLVPQDPNDEPAEAILRATHSLFDRLVAAKKLSAPKPLPPIEDDEVPFSLPIGWAWSRFGQILRISSGDGLVAKDMNAGPIPVYGGNGVNGYHDAHNVAKRTLVIGRVGFYCGSIHVTPEKAWVTDNAFITTFDEEHVDMDFLSWLLKATDLRERDNATAQPVISGGKVYPTVLPLPPLAEQRRIVAKVEQLMALVDALETQLAASRATAANLLTALVAELTTSRLPANP